MTMSPRLAEKHLLWGGGHAAAAALREDAQPVVPLLKLGQYRGRAIAATVVDDEHLANVPVAKGLEGERSDDLGNGRFLV